MKTQRERRLNSRRMVQIPGTAVLSDSLTRHSVSLINLSQTGAQVAVPKPADLPSTFTLLFEHTLQPFRLIWRRDDRIGVSFSE